MNYSGNHGLCSPRLCTLNEEKPNNKFNYRLRYWYRQKMKQSTGDRHKEDWVLFQIDCQERSFSDDF